MSIVVFIDDQKYGDENMGAHMPVRKRWRSQTFFR